MSDWRVALAQASYDAFDGSDFDALFEIWHPECEWVMGPWAPLAAEPVFRGHNGLRRWIDQVTGDFGETRLRLVEARPLGDDLLIRGHNRVLMKGMSTPLEIRYGQIVAFHDRMILRVTQTEDPPPGWETAGR